MESKTVKAIKCPNPECGHTMKVAHPGRAGVFVLTCPACKTKHQFRFSEPSQASESEAKSAGVKVATAKAEAIRLTLDFVVDHGYYVVCPHCGVHKMEFKAEKAGNYTLKCPKCGGVSLAQVRDKTRPISSATSLVLGKCKLEQVRGMFLPNREYVLDVGVYVVGRYDETLNSDIAIKNDMNMSRRSVQITVSNATGSYSYVMRVLNATNQVMYNGTPLKVGSEISLLPGDEFVLGVTKFRFLKV